MYAILATVPVLMQSAALSTMESTRGSVTPFLQPKAVQAPAGAGGALADTEFSW